MNKTLKIILAIVGGLVLIGVLGSLIGSSETSQPNDPERENEAETFQQAEPEQQPEPEPEPEVEELDDPDLAEVKDIRKDLFALDKRIIPAISNCDLETIVIESENLNAITARINTLAEKVTANEVDSGAIVVMQPINDEIGQRLEIMELYPEWIALCGQ